MPLAGAWGCASYGVFGKVLRRRRRQGERRNPCERREREGKRREGGVGRRSDARAAAGVAGDDDARRREAVVVEVGVAELAARPALDDVAIQAQHRVARARHVGRGDPQRVQGRFDVEEGARGDELDLLQHLGVGGPVADGAVVLDHQLRLAAGVEPVDLRVNALRPERRLNRGGSQNRADRGARRLAAGRALCACRLRCRGRFSRHGWWRRSLRLAGSRRCRWPRRACVARWKRGERAGGRSRSRRVSGRLRHRASRDSQPNGRQE